MHLLGVFLSDELPVFLLIAEYEVVRGYGRWVVHPIPWNVLPLGLLGRRELLLLDPLCIGYFCTLILPRPGQSLLLLEGLVLEALHLGGEARKGLHHRDAEFVQPVKLHALGRLHRPVNLVEPLVRLVGAGTLNDNFFIVLPGLTRG